MVPSSRRLERNLWTIGDTDAIEGLSLHAMRARYGNGFPPVSSRREFGGFRDRRSSGAPWRVSGAPWRVSGTQGLAREARRARGRGGD
jgi:hypothetical protein